MLSCFLHLTRNKTYNYGLPYVSFLITQNTITNTDTNSPALPTLAFTLQIINPLSFYDINPRPQTPATFARALIFS